MNWEGTETSAKLLFASVGALLSEIVGGLDIVVYVLLYMAIADYITGLMASYKNRIPWRSRRATEGVNGKIYMFMLIGAAHLVGENILQMKHALRDGAAFWYIGKEFISLMENGLNIGAPVPKWLRDVIEPVISKAYKGEEKKNGTS